MSSRTTTPRLLGAPLLALLAALPLAGCAGGGGDGGGSVSASTTTGGTGTSTGTGTTSGASQAQSTRALAALSTPLGAPALDQAGLDAHALMAERAWPEVRRGMVDPLLEAAIRAQIAPLAHGGNLQVMNLRNLVIDTAAPVGVSCGPVVGQRQTLSFSAPRAPLGWRVGCTVDVVAYVTVYVLGVPISVGTTFDVSVDVADVRVEASGTLDYAPGAVPAVVAVGAPSANLRITLSSSDPLFQQVAGTVTQVLDPLLRIAIVGGAVYAQQQAMPLLRQYTTMPFRAAAQPAQGVPGAPALDVLAAEISDEVQRHHLPWGTLLPAVMSDPTFGRGTPVEYYDHGDSAGWTMQYVMGEVMRHELTGDPRALAGAERGLTGLRRCLDTGGAGQGLLGRSAVLASDPLVRQISSNPFYYEGLSGGVLYGTTGDTSRDHYIDALAGLSQVWLRAPAMRARAADMIVEMNDGIQRTDLVSYQKPGSSALAVATPWAQAPGGVWAFALASGVIDPAGHGALLARTAPVSSVVWLAFWSSALDNHASYYKFFIGGSEIMTLAAMETDPARYRDVARTVEIHHAAVKDHDNAWFDTLYGVVVPSAAAAMGPRVKNALERWTLRPRRMFDARLMSDPTVPKGTFLDAQSGIVKNVALEPVPIEKRCSHDYLWQVSPFSVESWVRPSTHQYPGIDLTHPYWVARSYGLIP